MKLKKEYLIILLVIIGLSVYIATRSSDRVTYELPRFKPVAQDKLTQITIEKADGVIQLHKKDKQWFVGERNYPARNRSVTNLLQALGQLQVTDLVSQARNYSRYALDQKQGLAVKAWTEDDLVRSFLVGKAASTYRNSYVKLGDDPNVYLSKTNVRSRFDKEEGDFQDKTVLRFQDKQIKTIALTGPKRALTLTRKTAKAKSKQGQEAQTTNAVWISDRGQEIDTSLVEELLQTVSGLTCSSYLQHKEKQDFNTPDYSLALSGQEEDRLFLYVKQKKDDTTEYQGTSRENDFPFALSEQRGQRIVQAMNKLLDS